MKTNETNPTPEIRAAFNRFEKWDKPNIFSTIESLTAAEIRRFHACANANDDASKLAACFEEPSPVATFEFDDENRLERFSDNSLYEKSSADSTVWADYRDFRTERVRDEVLTSGLAAFFQEEAPEEPSSFRITVRSHHYGPLTKERFAEEDAPGQSPLSFPTRESAQAWIDDRESGEYRLSHNESGRPTYIITPIE